MGPIKGRADPDGPGWWGERVKQRDPKVDAYERKINPNDESYYVDNADGSKVQFENFEGDYLVDGKFVDKKPSAYTPRDMPHAKQSVLKEAKRQVEAASQNGKKVKWKVSDAEAAEQLSELFSTENVPITVEHFPP